VEGGIRTCILENFGDTPFSGGEAEPQVVAWMTRIGLALRATWGNTLRLGINVLRNAPLGSLAVASAVEAAFIRVNVHSGVMVTDQGILEGRARDTLLLRSRLGLDCFIAADLRVKHAAPLVARSLSAEARETWFRARADALILTGEATGDPADPDQIDLVREAVPEARIWLGSGLTPENAPRYRSRCDALIVGSYLHEAGRLDLPLDPARVRAVVESLA
jgi:hypothetical protein